MSLIDSTIAPPPPAPRKINNGFLLTNVSWLLDTRKDAMNKKKYFTFIFLFAKDYRTMTSGLQVASCFRRYSRELVSKPAISF